MLKRAEIKQGDAVTWQKPIDSRLDYIACLDAKVIELKDDRAIIEVRQNNTINAPIVEYSVDINDLESKTWIRDEEKYTKRKTDRRAAAQVVTDRECECLIEDDGEEYFYGVAQYLEHCDDLEIEPDEFLWACNLEAIGQYASANDFEEHVIEQWGEGADVKGLDELQAAIDRFYEANAPLKLIATDYSKIVLVPAHKTV